MNMQCAGAAGEVQQPASVAGGGVIGGKAHHAAATEWSQEMMHVVKRGIVMYMNITRKLTEKGRARALQRVHWRSIPPRVDTMRRRRTQAARPEGRQPQGQPTGTVQVKPAV